ncbi:MAG: hypothetical protein U0792_21890 [Gemmataceae bacterium]
MARLWLGVAAMVAGLTGCANSAHYVEQHTESGVVAIAENTDKFPTFNRTEALALIEKHVGPNYEIVEERAFTATRRNLRNQHAQTEHVPNPNRIEGSPPIRDTSDNLGTHEVTEWRISYRKRFSTWLGDNNPGGSVATETPTPPAADAVQQVQGTATPTPPVVHAHALIPSVAPVNVVPAGGCPDGRCNPR